MGVVDGTGQRDGLLPALPLAAALTLVGARSLPLRFEYQPNDLGIVSVSTELAYPHQQETFYLLFAVLVGSLLSWILSRALGRRGPSPANALALEVLAAAVLVGVLWLPLIPGWGVALVGTFLALWRSGRSGAPQPQPSSVAPRAARPTRDLIWSIAALIVAPLLTPGLAFRVWAVAEGIPDELLAQDHFKFLAETGQHLAWANALRAGALHGRDFFCLYGPLYDLGGVAMWALVGRSIAAWNLYFSLTRALAWAALLLLAGTLVRRRWLALLPVFLLPWLNLRVGLPLFGLLLLSKSLSAGPGAGWAAAAGAFGGVSLLFSQEHAIAFLLAACLVLALRADSRRALAFCAALAISIAPVVGYYAAHDALVPMLRDLFQYPGYVLAGFGKLPFPAVETSLMGDATAAGRQASLVLRLGYAVPAVCVGAALLALPVSAIDPRRPWHTLGAAGRGLRDDAARLSILGVAVFGLVSYRSALGRSDLGHMIAALPAATVLLSVGIDRALEAWARGGAWRRLAAWRLAALALLIAHAGFLQTTSPTALIAESLGNISALMQRVSLPSGDPGVARVARFVRRHTQPGEPVLFMPNDAAYYYLADRPSPIRYVMGHQMVTDAQRAEALADLEAHPPRYVVWNQGSHRVDALSDEQVFGPALLDWLDRHYEIETRIGEVEIRRLRSFSKP